MPRDIAIRAVGLGKKFRSGDADLVVFSGLDLEIQRGQQLALVGESGAGKSTLLHLLGGLDRPSAGRIFFGPEELTGLADAELAAFRNRTLGFVWQGHYLLREFTALENVMMPLLIRGASHSEAETFPAGAREAIRGGRLRLSTVSVHRFSTDSAPSETTARTG